MDVDRRERDRDRGDDRRRSEPRRRSRSRSRDRDRRRRSRSRDRSRSRGDRRRSPEYDPEASRRRPTWFDIPPIGGAPPPLSQLPGAVQVFNVPHGGAGMGGMSVAPAASSAMSQQATRHARRIYVGGLPPAGLNEQNIQTFFSNALAAVGGTTAGPGMCVVNVYINYEKKFAFVEMRTVEEASNAMALDGIMFEGVTVRIRRPADYNAAAAAALGPAMPNPNLNLAAIGLDKQPVQVAAPTANLLQQMMAPAGMTGGVPQQQHNMSAQDAAERIFVGGLPYYLTEEQCRELLGSFGSIKSFDLVKDRETQQSKGYGFAVYDDPRVTDVACAGLNGMQMGDRTLTVRRAQEGQRQAAEQKAQQAQQVLQAPQMPAVYVGNSARVVKLAHAVTMEELVNDDEYGDIMDDMKEECGKYGTVIQVHIPRPAPPGAPPPPGLGKVLIEFVDTAAAMGARNAMHGRKFGGRIVEAVLMGDTDYKEFKWD